MKYDLKNFRRAADRHIANMEMSETGRAGLTRPRKTRTNPLLWTGWAAAMVACLVLLLTFNMPAGGRTGMPGEYPDRDADYKTTQGDLPGENLALGTGMDNIDSQDTDVEPQSGDTDGGEALPEDGSGNSGEMLSGSADLSGDAGDESSANVSSGGLFMAGARDDIRAVFTDYAEREYYFIDKSDENKSDETVFYTEAEVRATDAGREYFEKNIGYEFQYYNWPRADKIVYLPEIEEGYWQCYYTELDVGTVLWGDKTWKSTAQSYTVENIDKFALANRDGLITGYIYVRLDYFSEYGYALASIEDESTASLEGDGGYTRYQYGLIDSTGAWKVEPQRSEINEIYDMSMDDSYDLNMNAVAYIRDVLGARQESYNDNGEEKQFWSDYTIRSEIIGVDGEIKLTARSIGYMWSTMSSDSLIPYQDLQTELWGYADINGKTVIEPQYRDAQGFSCGLAAVQVEDSDMGYMQYGFINESGEFAIEPQYDYVPFGFSDGGVAQVYSYDEGIYRRINTEGEDVTSQLDLLGQRWNRLREGMPLERTLSNWAVVVMLIALAMRMYAHKALKNGEEARFSRMLAGLCAFASAVMLNCALSSEVHTATPCLFRDSGLDATWRMNAVYALEAGFALVAGAIQCWSVRQIFGRKWQQAAMLIILPLAMPLLRFALVASTAMDIGMVLAMAAGELIGLAAHIQPLEYENRRALKRLAPAAAGILFAAALLWFSVGEWNGTMYVSNVEYSMGALSLSSNTEYFTGVLNAEENSETNWQMQSDNGMEWRDLLKKYLDEPDNFSVLKIDVTVSNDSMRDVKSGSVRVNYHGLLRSPYEYQFISVPSHGSTTVTYMFITNTEGIPDAQWLTSFINTDQLILTVEY